MTPSTKATPSQDVGAGLPCPRLQFRWVPDPTGEMQWVSIYEIVLPLREHDIRRETAKNAKGEMAVELGRTRRGGGSFSIPNDMPFRDGCHARWDGEALGGLPVLVIDPNGAAWVEEQIDAGSRMVPALSKSDPSL